MPLTVTLMELQWDASHLVVTTSPDTTRATKQQIDNLLANTRIEQSVDDRSGPAVTETRVDMARRITGLTVSQTNSGSAYGWQLLQKTRSVDKWWTTSPSNELRSWWCCSDSDRESSKRSTTCHGQRHTTNRPSMTSSIFTTCLWWCLLVAVLRAPITTWQQHYCMQSRSTSDV